MTESGNLVKSANPPRSGIKCHVQINSTRFSGSREVLDTILSHTRSPTRNIDNKAYATRILPLNKHRGMMTARYVTTLYSISLVFSRSAGPKSLDWKFVLTKAPHKIPCRGRSGHSAVPSSILGGPLQHSDIEETMGCLSNLTGRQPLA